MKYEFTGKTKIVNGRTLKQIRALITILDVVNSGECGGWVESEQNLAQVYGNAWVSGDAQVYGNARVYGNTWVYGNAQVSGNALVENRNAICTFSGFGSEYRTTTAFTDEKLGVRIVCGCFSGSLDEFRAQIIKKHGNDSKHGRLYLSMANMIEYRLTDNYVGGGVKIDAVREGES